MGLWKGRWMLTRVRGRLQAAREAIGDGGEVVWIGEIFYS